MSGVGRIRRYFERLPFRIKLVAALLVTSAVALTAVSAVLVYLQYQTTIRTTYRIQQLTNQGVAGIVAAPLVARDTAEVLRVLRQLDAVAVIRKVRLYDLEGRDILTLTRLSPLPSGRKSVSVAPILHRGRPLAMVELTTVEDFRASLTADYLTAVSVIVVGIFILSLLIATGISSILFRPLNTMTRAMQRIRDSRNYTQRVERSGDEETCRIIDTLNTMLDEIERRENALATAAVDIARARDDAQRASESKSQFLANMSHELRTPLNAIIGYADVLQQDLSDQQQTQLAEDARWIDGSARHLLGMINELLDMAKIEAGHVELHIHEVSIAEIMENVLTTLEPIAHMQGNTLELRAAADLGIACLDAGKLRQCLINIGGNACKFTQGGHVIITVRIMMIARREWLEVSISDSGIGMAPEQIARLFEPFVQADPSATRRFGGTGLGLAITARLVEIIGARLAVDSLPGVGSTFRLRVPRYHTEMDQLAMGPADVGEGVSINRQPYDDYMAA